MDKMILGRYLPGQSFLHKMDPRAKMLALLLFVLVLFFATSIWSNLLLFGLVLGLLMVSKIPVKFFLQGLQSIFYLLLFTTLFQLFFTPGGQTIWQFGFLSISQKGLEQAGIIFCRFILIVSFSTLLTLTTTPLALADAVEYLLSPLKRVGVPVHEIGLMLSMSLRFVPTLMDDTVKIMNAQRARGVDFEQGGLIKRMKSLLPILIPLFASSFKRADALAIAMEARGYQGSEGRSRYRQLKWRKSDSLALLLLFLICLAAYFLAW